EERSKCEAGTAKWSRAVIEQNSASAADLDCTFRIVDRHDSLQAELTVPKPDHRGHIVPSHGRIEHFGKVTPDRYSAAAHVDVLIQLRHLETFMGQIVDGPSRFDGELQHSAKC